MTTSSGPSIVLNGLALYADGDNLNSFKGAPTTNYMYKMNPRIDSSYSSFVKTTDGTWVTKHQDAITVYNDLGENISDYVNTGVVNWQNTYHAIWTYDEVLQKPVITMRNLDSPNWKAQSSGLGMNFSSLGMTVGSKYVISWLQWSNDISRPADVGLYTANASNSLDFWDGLSKASETSKNTKEQTWERVYHVYTVSPNRNLSNTNVSVYMYGMNFGTTITKISDVQLELYPNPTNFSKSQTRGSTVATGGGLIDISGNSNIGTFSGDIRQTFTSPKTLSLDGVDDTVSFPLTLTDIAALSNFTMSVWVKIPDYPTAVTAPAVRKGVLLGAAYYAGAAIYWNGNLTGTGLSVAAYIRGNDAQRQTTYHNIPLNSWTNLVMVNDRSTSLIKLYINGVLTATAASATQEYNSGNATTAGNIGISKPQVDGGGTDTYSYLKCDISNVMVYKNKALTDSEVLANFNALRGRYGV